MNIWQHCCAKCGNPVGQTVSKMLPIDFSSQKTVPYKFLAFYRVLYVNNSEIRISGNPVMRNLATLLIGEFQKWPHSIPWPDKYKYANFQLDTISTLKELIFETRFVIL